MLRHATRQPASLAIAPSQVDKAWAASWQRRALRHLALSLLPRWRRRQLPNLQLLLCLALLLHGLLLRQQSHRLLHSLQPPQGSLCQQAPALFWWRLCLQLLPTGLLRCLLLLLPPKLLLLLIAVPLLCALCMLSLLDFLDRRQYSHTASAARCCCCCCCRSHTRVCASFAGPL